MPNVILKVSLKDNSLDVDQAGNGNQMGHGQVTTISWQLTGNAAGGSFNSINATSPGFAWIQTPTNNVFTGLQLTNNGEIQITDNNNDPGGISSIGEWIYQLCATINGKPYSTIATSPRATTTDPTIKNL
ncbi:hypothetical protein IMW82_16160 [Rhodanobacter sp. B2A1Ga4]|uniref:hypothetical protein n=1 Tax=Rhodanobacter sp. B2A1Ga4 TaxID=2778647 RepID=UPI001B368195|nr:hypothetical protein [Rhodanobacter sp. B2A1Ga4]MBQ4856203.1 hypothetical protein [Rhodanobacter sp. B2A1Ga4]